MTGTAEATVVDGRVWVRTRGDFDAMLAASKAVTGGRFSRVPSPHWSYPLSVETCHALRRAFGDALTIQPRLAQWYRAAAKRNAAHTRLGRADDAPLPHLSAAYPGFADWLRPYQRAGALWAAQGYRGGGVVADMPGVGKTGEVLAALVEGDVRGPVLVLCPKASVKAVWGRHLRELLPDVPRYGLYGTRKRRETQLARFAEDLRQDPHVLRIVVAVAETLRVEMGRPCLTREGGRVPGICPRGEAHRRNHVAKDVDKKHYVPVGFQFPDIFDKTLLGGGWAGIVIDESHKLLGSLSVVRGNLMGRGLKLLPERQVFRRALSGTPFGKGGRVEGLFGTLHWLWPDEYSSYWRWVGEKFEVEEKRINRKGDTAKKIIGLKGLPATASAEVELQVIETFLQELGPRILRRTKAEVLPALEPKRYVEVVCGMTPLQRAQYAAMALYAEVDTSGGPLMANGALALLTRARQMANGAVTMRGDKLTFLPDGGKLERLEEALEERGIVDGAPGTKLVIASAFNEYLDTLADWLREKGVGFLRYDGRLSQRARDMTQAAWQSETVVRENRVLLLNATAGGLSIDLDAADEMHIMDELPDPGANEQLEDRLHRASRNHSVTIFYYRTEGTYDYERAHNVEYRRRAQHAILDGSRGMVYVRDMLIEALDKEKL